jgi:hypothetical protein
MIIIGRIAYRSLACHRGSRQHWDLDGAPYPQGVFDGEHDHREHVERSEFPAIPLGELGNRICGKRDGVEEDQDNDEAVDDATHRMGIAADLEHIMNFAPQAPIGGCRAHAQARPARRLVSALSDAMLVAGASV